MFVLFVSAEVLFDNAFSLLFLFEHTASPKTNLMTLFKPSSINLLFPAEMQSSLQETLILIMALLEVAGLS